MIMEKTDPNRDHEQVDGPAIITYDDDSIRFTFFWTERVHQKT